MPRVCCVAVCKAKYKGLSHHRFPADPAVRLHWIEACNRKDHFDANKGGVCERHFLPSDYERDFRNELLNLPLRKILKPGTIPTQNLTAADIAESDVASKSFAKENLVSKSQLPVKILPKPEVDTGPNLPSTRVIFVKRVQTDYKPKSFTSSPNGTRPRTSVLKSSPGPTEAKVRKLSDSQVSHDGPEPLEVVSVQMIEDDTPVDLNDVNSDVEESVGYLKTRVQILEEELTQMRNKVTMLTQRLQSQKEVNIELQSQLRQYESERATSNGPLMEGKFYRDDDDDLSDLELEVIGSDSSDSDNS